MNTTNFETIKHLFSDCPAVRNFRTGNSGFQRITGNRGTYRVQAIRSAAIVARFKPSGRTQPNYAPAGTRSRTRAVRFAQGMEGCFKRRGRCQAFLEGSSRYPKLPATGGYFEYKVKKLGEADGLHRSVVEGRDPRGNEKWGRTRSRAYEQAGNTHGLKEEELPASSSCPTLNASGCTIWRTAPSLNSGSTSWWVIYPTLRGDHRLPEESLPGNRTRQHQSGGADGAASTTGFSRRSVHGTSAGGVLVRILFCLFCRRRRSSTNSSSRFPRATHTTRRLRPWRHAGRTLPGAEHREPEKRLEEEPRRTTGGVPVCERPFVRRAPLAKSFDAKMRARPCRLLFHRLGAGSPGHFRPMFQSVMNPQERRNRGAHYTSEKNILRLIRPLFLDALWEEFGKA